MEETPERYGRDVVVLIPVFEPGRMLPDFVERLSKRFERIVLVDDGSTCGLEHLEAVRPFVERILRHAVNSGKGAALKTGLGYIGDADVVTADADGQHSVEDIVRIASALRTHREGIVLGVRAFNGHVPFRSRFGNWWTRLVFGMLTGLWVADTQTGLRGIPSELAARVRVLPGDRYEYEIVMLADARRHAMKPLQIPIETIYTDGNPESHFSPVRDSFRIYRALFGFLLKRRDK